LDHQELSVSFHATPGDEALQDGALRTELLDRLKTAPRAVARVRVEGNDDLAPQAVLPQETLHRRWQPHRPGREAHEHDVVLVDTVDLRLQGRQIAGLVLPDDLLHGCPIVSRVRSLQFERDDRAADLLMDDVRDGLGVVGPGQIDDEDVLPRQRRSNLRGLRTGTTEQNTDDSGNDE
jgi:hypothetical protein